MDGFLSCRMRYRTGMNTHQGSGAASGSTPEQIPFGANAESRKQIWPGSRASIRILTHEISWMLGNRPCRIGPRSAHSLFHGMIQTSGPGPWIHPWISRVMRRDRLQAHVLCCTEPLRSTVLNLDAPLLPQAVVIATGGTRSWTVQGKRGGPSL